MINTANSKYGLIKNYIVCAYKNTEIKPYVLSFFKGDISSDFRERSARFRQLFPSGLGNIELVFYRTDGGKCSFVTVISKFENQYIEKCNFSISADGFITPENTFIPKFSYINGKFKSAQIFNVGDVEFLSPILDLEPNGKNDDGSRFNSSGACLNKVYQIRSGKRNHYLAWSKELQKARTFQVNKDFIRPILPIWKIHLFFGNGEERSISLLKEPVQISGKGVKKIIITDFYDNDHEYEMCYLQE